MKEEEQKNKNISLISYIFLGLLIFAVGLSLGVFLNLYILSIQIPERLEASEQVKVLKDAVLSSEKVQKKEEAEQEKISTSQIKNQVENIKEKRDLEIDKDYAQKQLRAMLNKINGCIEVKLLLPLQAAMLQEETFIKHIVHRNKIKDLGSFKITAYCACEKCCDEWADGLTFTETVAKPEHTISVDPSIIPLGSKVIIDGKIYAAEDIGGAIKGNIIDMFFATHEETIVYGVQQHEVYLIEE